MNELIVAAQLAWEVLKFKLEKGKFQKVEDKKTKELLNDKGFIQELRNVSNSPITVFSINGDLHIGDFSKIPKQIKNKLIAQYEEKGIVQEKEINVMTDDFYQRVREFRKQKIDPTRIDKIKKYLTVDKLNILNLAIRVRELYKSKSKEATAIKGDIGMHYGKDGNQLCNLYTSNYVDAMIEFMELSGIFELSEIEIAREVGIRLDGLIREPIYYIHEGSVVAEIVSSIMLDLKNKEKYIAVHSAGVNNKRKANKINDKIKKIAKEFNYTHKIEDEQLPSGVPVFAILLNLSVQN